MSTSVINIRSGKPYDVYVGRGRNSKWGNPFVVGRDGTLEEVLRKYQDWLPQQVELLRDLHELKDKVLGCWCRPKAGFKMRLLCHGQILAGLCDGVRPETVE